MKARISGGEKTAQGVDLGWMVAGSVLEIRCAPGAFLMLCEVQSSGSARRLPRQWRVTATRSLTQICIPADGFWHLQLEADNAPHLADFHVAMIA